MSAPDGWQEGWDAAEQDLIEKVLTYNPYVYESVSYFNWEDGYNEHLAMVEKTLNLLNKVM